MAIINRCGSVGNVGTIHPAKLPVCMVWVAGLLEPDVKQNNRTGKKCGFYTKVSVQEGGSRFARG